YEKEESESLFSLISKILKQKNFTAFLIIILCYFTMINTWGASLLYYARYVLLTEAELVSLFLGVMFAGAGIGVIIWLYYFRKTHNSRIILIYGGFIMAIPATLISFITNTNAIFFIMIIVGLGVGGFLVMMNPTFSDVVDESILKTHSRNEGLIGGLRFFVMNLSRVTTAVILTVVHISTGFIEGSDIQPDSAILGIQLHTGLIPALFFLLGIIIFAIYYDLTPEKASKIKKKLSELNL
ncbi:MAG: MFS transporter, partial [Candidatus Hodarchaeales archaeon]